MWVLTHRPLYVHDILDHKTDDKSGGCGYQGTGEAPHDLVTTNGWRRTIARSSIDPTRRQPKLKNTYVSAHDVRRHAAAFPRLRVIESEDLTMVSQQTR